MNKLIQHDRLANKLILECVDGATAQKAAQYLKENVKLLPNNRVELRKSIINIDSLWNNGIKFLFDDSALGMLERVAEIGLARETAIYLKQHGYELNDGNYPYKRQPMDHQRFAFNLSRDIKIFGLFMEQGTGKTKVLLDNAAYLYLLGKIDMLIVIAWPNGVHRNWCEYEIPKDVPDCTDWAAAYWSSSRTKKIMYGLDRVRDKASGLRILTFNVEAFTSEHARTYILDCIEKHRVMLAIDQSASIKNHKSKRAEFITEKLAPLSHYRRILDGAPISEGAHELYSQFLFLDRDIIGCSTWTSFKAQYTISGRYNNIEGLQNSQELMGKVEPFTYRVLQKDCIDLPERVYKRWVFDLSKEEKLKFEVLRQKNILDFKRADDGTELTVLESALVKNLRLQQIASGTIYNEHTGELDKIVETPSRLQSLALLIQQMEGKAVIYARFTYDIEAIKAMLGDEALTFYGKTSDDDRSYAKQQFMNNPKVRFLVGQPQTLGIGHTLTSASNVIFYTNSDSLRLREECEKRVHRKGLEDTIVDGSLIIWDLVAKGTTDRKMLRAFRMKKDLSELLMSDPQSFFLAEN